MQNYITMYEVRQVPLKMDRVYCLLTFKDRPPDETRNQKHRFTPIFCFLPIYYFYFYLSDSSQRYIYLFICYIIHCVYAYIVTCIFLEQKNMTKAHLMVSDIPVHNNTKVQTNRRYFALHWTLQPEMIYLRPIITPEMLSLKPGHCCAYTLMLEH